MNIIIEKVENGFIYSCNYKNYISEDGEEMYICIKSYLREILNTLDYNKPLVIQVVAKEESKEI